MMVMVMPSGWRFRAAKLWSTRLVQLLAHCHQYTKQKQNQEMLSKFRISDIASLEEVVIKHYLLFVTFCDFLK